jgi:hypothetical protein
MERSPLQKFAEYVWLQNSLSGAAQEDESVIGVLQH